MHSTPLMATCTREQWEQGVLLGRPFLDGVDPALLRSWQESRAAGVSPDVAIPAAVLPPPEFAQRLEANRDLLGRSLPSMELLKVIIQGSGFLVVLSDHEGLTLKIMGDEPIKAKAARNYYVEGCLRGVTPAGTNAISLCLSERRPVQLTGYGHYRTMYHDWTCCSAPILDAMGGLLGVLTLSGPKDHPQLHTLGLVVSAAAHISGLIREHSLYREKAQLSELLKLIHNSLGEGIVSLDENLAVTHVNLAAARLLETAEEECLGRAFETVARPDPGFLEALRSGVPLETLEVTLHLPMGPRQFVCRVNRLRNVSRNVLLTLVEKHSYLRVSSRIRERGAKYEFSDIVGRDPVLLEQIGLARMAAHATDRVVITGETGTGKELFAQSIHNEGPRRNEPFVAISCPTLPTELVESELFGHERGSFTGARREGMPGKLELAHRGTVFLDEINSLPLAVQAKLLRALQEREIMRVGGARPLAVDIFIIAASNADLREKVRQGLFREDLYHRLSVIEINIPPLRERLEDVEALGAHILGRVCRRMGKTPRELSPGAVERLMDWRWPGNVRELENVLERALIKALWAEPSLRTLRAGHFQHLGQGEASSTPAGREAQAARMQGQTGPRGLDARYREALEEAVARHGGRMAAVARELGISRSTLYRKLERFGLR